MLVLIIPDYLLLTDNKHSIMLALIIPEYFLLTDNKHSIYFDRSTKLSSKSWNAQVTLFSL